MSYHILQLGRLLLKHICWQLLVVIKCTTFKWKQSNQIRFQNRIFKPKASTHNQKKNPKKLMNDWNLFWDTQLKNEDSSLHTARFFQQSEVILSFPRLLLFMLQQHFLLNWFKTFPEGLQWTCSLPARHQKQYGKGYFATYKVNWYIDKMLKKGSKII